MLFTSRRKIAGWWFGSFILLCAVFVSGVFEHDALPALIGKYPTAPLNTRPYFDQISETLVDNAIDQALLGLPTHTGGFMFHLAQDPRHLQIGSPEQYRPEWRPGAEDFRGAIAYRSQFGLPARLYAAAAPRLGLDREQTFRIFHAFSAAMLACMLAIIVAFIAAAWGTGAALASLTFATFATGFGLFAPSLYWSTFLHVAPTALVAATASPARAPAWHKQLLWPALAAVFCAKFLSGFEFGTVTIASATIPWFALYSVNAVPLRVCLRQAGAVAGLGILGFCAALLVFDAAHRQAFGTSGLDHLAERSMAWGLRPPMSLNESLLQILKVLVVNVVDVSGYGVPVAAVAVAGILASLYAAKRARTGLSEETERIALALAASFLASVSWVLVQPHHLLFHPRYATIVLAFPFGMFLAAAIPRLQSSRRERTMGPGAIQSNTSTS
jgi:hypothetical protein